MSRDLTKCKHCDAWINPEFGAYDPVEYAGRSGDESDPRAPGDFDNICDDCDYGKGLN